MGFFTICSGVVLLQLSKSAKDVPDAAVFSGDLDQVRTIAEQEQPESEPKADAIRGAAAIVRRFSVTRQKMEMEEVRRLHEEKLRDLEPIGENEQIEWDGLRRRRTIVGTPPRGIVTPRTPQQHPPLGMSHFPTDEELQDEENRPHTGGLGSSLLGSIRSRARSIALSGQSRQYDSDPTVQSPMHPVPLTEIAIPSYKGQDTASGAYYGHSDPGDQVYSLPEGLRGQKTAYEGGGGGHRVQFSDPADRPVSRGALGPIPPSHSARRQFSFHNVFRKGQASQVDEPAPPSRPVTSRKGLGSRQSSNSTTKGATEEERLGLVKGDTNVTFPEYNEDEIDEDYDLERKRRPSPPRNRDVRVVAGDSPPRMDPSDDEQEKEEWTHPGGPPPQFDDGNGNGAFI
jgi:magnesium transporter